VCGGEPLTVTDALAMLDHALDSLNGTDVATLPADTQAHALRALERAEAKHTAARARVLAAFSAHDGYEADGQGSARTWLRWQTRITKGAAAGAVGWMRRLGAHPVIAEALAAGELSASWAKDICGWTGRLPHAARADADEILTAAARAGADQADLAGLAQEMFERTRGPDTGPSDFDERAVWLGATIGGAGRLTGDLTPGATAALTAVLDALGKRAGPEDLRTTAQRRHDALAEACQRLLAAGLLPGAGGKPAHAQVHLTLSQLRDLPGAPGAEAAWATAHTGPPNDSAGAAARAAGPRGPATPAAHTSQPGQPNHTTGAAASASEQGCPAGQPHRPGGDRAWATGDRAWASGEGAWAAARASEPGWLTGPEAAAAACDATVLPVVTGHPDAAALDRLTNLVLAGHGQHPGKPCGCGCGNCGCRARQPPPQATRARLAKALLGLCADVLSGPGGLASWLRQTQLTGAPAAGPSLPLNLPIPLDTGAAEPTIPAHLRRAALARHRHCAFPGCPRPAPACHLHHLIPRSEGGPTALWNLLPACDFHHLIVIHDWGWTLRLNPDGTTTATSPDRTQTLHSHSPPQQAA
jgi:hypothetical protein